MKISSNSVALIFLLIGLSSSVAQSKSVKLRSYLAMSQLHPAEILDPPDNVTVFLDQSAVFVCETDGGIPGWRVNGMLLSDLPPDIRSDLEIMETNTDEGSTLEQLTIPAIAKYNMTKVQCLAVSFNSVESDNAAIKIQGVEKHFMCKCMAVTLLLSSGILSAVTDLASINNETSVTISWTAPFSLDVTGVHPDIWYSVLIYNVTDENNPTAILCTNCTNITETHYTFTPDYLNACHEYNFSVIPFNGAGQGESSTNITGYVLYCQ